MPAERGLWRRGQRHGHPVQSGSNELQLTAGCGGTITNTCATPIRLAVTRAAITLRDDVFPVPSNLRGELFAPTAKSGIVNTVFDVADAGGGVYRTVTAVDNNVIAVTPAALGTCTDINPTNDTPFEFAGAVRVRRRRSR